MIGSKIDEVGTLIRENGVLFLRRDAGGRYQLEEGRIDAAPEGERVRLIGVIIGNDLVDALTLELEPGGI